MDSVSTPAAKQSIFSRVFFFAIGGAFSALLNTSAYRLLHDMLGLPPAAAYAISLLFITTVLFMWSYFVNFRTAQAWNDCIGRYLTCVALCYAINYFIGLSGIKKWGHGFWTTFLVIGLVQSMTGCVKFLLYHFWVFPHENGSVPASNAPAAPGR